MVFHMKTTLVIDDQLMRRLKEEAARRGATMSSLVEDALRQLLDALDGESPAVPDLPAFAGGRFTVDVADREALDAVLDEG